MAQSLAYRCSLVLACLLGFASSCGVASAQRGPRAAALHWVRLPGAEDCSGGDALSRAVESKVRREVFPAPRNASVLIEGYVQRVAGGYRAALQMRSSDGDLLGSRELSSQASDCDELSEAIAVVLAVMIDPDTAPQGTGTAPPAPPAQGAPDARRVLGFARIALGLATHRPDGTTEQGIPLFGAGLAYERGLGKWGGLRLEAVVLSSRVVEHVTLRPSEMPARDAMPVSGDARLTLAYAGLGYCPLWLTTGRLRSAGCASAELGGIRAREPGTDFTQGSAPDAWFSASLYLRLALRLFGHVEAHFAGGVSALFFRSDFGVPPQQIDIKPVYGSLDVGLGVRF